jgi:hypothetical protein
MFWSPATLSHVSASYCFSEKRTKNYFTTYSFAILSRHFNNIPVTRQQEKRLQSRLHQLEDFYGGFLEFFYVIYSTLIYLPPLRSHCEGEDTVIETKTVATFLIGSQTF